MASHGIWEKAAMLRCGPLLGRRRFPDFGAEAAGDLREAEPRQPPEPNKRLAAADVAARPA